VKTAKAVATPRSEKRSDDEVKRTPEKPTCFALTIKALVFPAHDMRTREEVEEAAREMMDERFWDKDDLEVAAIPDTDEAFPHAEPYDLHAMKLTEGTPKRLKLHPGCGGKFVETKTKKSSRGPWTCDKCGFVTETVDPRHWPKRAKLRKASG